MKALVVFLVVIVLGFGFVEFVTWIGEEPPTHVFHVTPNGTIKK